MAITRMQKRHINKYVDAVREGSVEEISDDKLRSVGIILNASAQRVFLQFRDNLKPQFQKAVDELEQAWRGNRLAGRTPLAQVILASYTPFEQIMALEQYLEHHAIQKTHTCVLGIKAYPSTESEIPAWLKRHWQPDPDQIVPISLNRPYKNLMHIRVGTSRGRHKAPKYPDWAQNDPRDNPNQSAFIAPLNALEMHRAQDAALLLKSNAFDAGWLKHDLRYQVWAEPDGKNPSKFASVELPNQQNRGEHKILAAGVNLTYLVSKVAHRNLLPPCLYEDYYSEGYRDDELPYLSPRKIVETFPEAICGNTDPLDAKMAKLLATRLEISSIPVVRHFTATQLFQEKQEA